MKDVLHSHVGDFNIWSKTDHFAFPIVITLKWSPLIFTSFNYAIRFLVFFLYEIIWHLYDL